MDPTITPHRYRDALAAELRAERDLERARAAAYVYLDARDKSGRQGPERVAYLQASLDTVPSVVKAQNKLIEARVERHVAEALLSARPAR
jgi:hypothetical protein